jgi:membrane fusion protein
LLTLLVVAAVVFVMTAGFSRKETVRGRLRSSAAEARVYATGVGSVTKLHVSLGEYVEQGALLAEVATPHQITTEQDVSQESQDVLQKERTTFVERGEAAIRSAEIERGRLRQAVIAIQQERGHVKESIALTRRRISIAKERVETAARLQLEGAVSKEDGRIREEALIAQQQQLVSFETRLAQLESQERTTAFDLQRIDENLAKETSDMDEKLAQIDANIVRARAEGGFVIKAPVSGRIAAIQVGEGQRVEPNRPLLTILPGGAILEAEAYVPSRAIAFVEPKQKVMLRIDSLPYQKFGPVAGTVAEVSQTTFAPNEISVPIAIEEPVYRVTIALDRQTVPAFGREILLQSGMQLDADIILEERRLSEWILEPVFAAGLRMRAPS